MKIFKSKIKPQFQVGYVNRGDMLSVADVKEILGIPLIGVIPESQAVLKASNSGVPVIMDDVSDAGQAYNDMVDRFLGKDIPLRFVVEEKQGLFKRLFKRKEGAAA